MNLSHYESLLLASKCDEIMLIFRIFIVQFFDQRHLYVNLYIFQKFNNGVSKLGNIAFLIHNMCPNTKISYYISSRSIYMSINYTHDNTLTIHTWHWTTLFQYDSDTFWKSGSSTRMCGNNIYFSYFYCIIFGQRHLCAIKYNLLKTI